MKKYEIMAIIKSDLSEADAQKYIQDKIIKSISDRGGKTSFEDFWGARGFAYKIKKYTWGYYYVAQFDLDPAQMQELRSELNIESNIVRFLMFNVDSKAPAPRKYSEMKAEQNAQEKKDGSAPEEAPKTMRKEKLTTTGS